MGPEPLAQGHKGVGQLPRPHAPSTIPGDTGECIWYAATAYRYPTTTTTIATTATATTTTACLRVVTTPQ